MKRVATVAALMLLNSLVFPQTLEDVVYATWGFQSSSAKGSCVLIKGKDKWYALTAGHCVEDCRSEKEEVMPDGSKKTKVVWEDVEIVQKLTANVDGVDIEVGKIILKAKVVAFSPPDEEDLALLEVYNMPFEMKSVSILPSLKDVKVGTQCWHVGNLYGELLSSVTDGIISSLGRYYRGKTWLQVTSTAVPGSSGGGIYIKVGEDYKLIGIVTMGDASTGNVIFAVPIYRIIQWLKKVNFSHIIEEKEGEGK